MTSWIKIAPKKEEVKGPMSAQLEGKAGSKLTTVVLRKGKTGKPKKKKGKKSVIPKLPPQIESVTVVPQVVRYIVQASPGSSNTINSAQIQAAQGGIVTVAATTMTGWASSVRITRIQIWPAASAAGSSIIGPEIIWKNAGVADLVRDESKLNTLPAGITGASNPIDAVPPSGTVASLWHHYDGTSHDVLTFANLVQGTVIDVHTVFTLQNNLSGVAISIASSALGAVGWPYLDTSAAKLLPAGKPVIS